MVAGNRLECRLRIYIVNVRLYLITTRQCQYQHWGRLLEEVDQFQDNGHEVEVFCRKEEQLQPHEIIYNRDTPTFFVVKPGSNCEVNFVGSLAKKLRDSAVLTTALTARVYYPNIILIEPNDCNFGDALIRYNSIMVPAANDHIAVIKLKGLIGLVGDSVTK